VGISIETLNAGGSLLGAGGAAGQVSSFLARVDLVGRPDSVPPSIAISTGQGGGGLSGGAGGSILGRNDLSSADIQTNRSQQNISESLSITAGAGGFGINAGGAGGAVSQLVAEFGGGPVAVLSGTGGYSPAGRGGGGGSIQLTPSPFISRLTGALLLEAGDGGEGIAGGQGGSLIGFINRPTSLTNPISTRAVAGDGGDAVTGSGGAGGSISNFSVTTSNSSGISLLLAGQGGLSAGGTGGAGGALSSATFTSEAGAVVAIAGAGGNGLRTGGAGGSIGNTDLKAGGLTNARVVAMAGAGGDGYGVSAATIQSEGTFPNFSTLYQTNILALGPANANGGIGGSITNFTQPAALKASVDLVAGNGGSTINYGLIGDKKTGVGRGGSMTNINLANDAGLMDANIPIRSYANDFAQLVEGLVSFGNLGPLGDDAIGTSGALVSSSQWQAQAFSTPSQGGPLQLDSVTLALNVNAPAGAPAEAIQSTDRASAHRVEVRRMRGVSARRGRRGHGLMSPIAEGIARLPPSLEPVSSPAGSPDSCRGIAPGPLP
jgi:hypothetical protein